MVRYCLANGHFEIAIALSGKLAFNLLIGLSGNTGINSHQVIDSIFSLAVCHLCFGISNSTFEFFNDGFRRIQNIDATLRVRIRFAHLLGWILQGHDLGAHFRDIAVRHHKSVAVLTVKTNRHVSCQLQMLFLINPHRHQVGLVQENIPCHQHRIGEQACIDIVRILSGFILKLGHTVQFSELGIAGQHPVGLRVFLDVALNKGNRFFRVHAAGQNQRIRFQRSLF